MNNDEKLLNLAKKYYYSNGKTPDGQIIKCFSKKSLNDTDRTALLDFITNNADIKPMSMTRMKMEILTAIKREDVLVDYTNTLSRKEVEAIYAYVMDQTKPKL